MVNAMVFLHLSDIHFLRNYPKENSGYNSIFNEMTNPLIKIKSCINKVSMKELKFIIITGDLVESGTADDYRTLKKELEMLFDGVPYIVTLGNHDNKTEFYKGWLNEDANDKPYNTVTDIDGIRVIGLDISEYHNNNGVISQDQCNWLMTELNKDPKKESILFLHHHLLKDQFNTPSVEVPKEFEEIISESSIVGIFTGHTHHVYNGTFSGKPYFTSGSLSFAGFNETNGLVRFEDTASCNICTYDDGIINVETVYGLDKQNVLGYVNFKG